MVGDWPPVTRPVPLLHEHGRRGLYRLDVGVVAGQATSGGIALGHLQCRETGHRLEVDRSPGKVLSGLCKVNVVPRQVTLWVMLEFKTGKVPTLIDTGAQFSCIRSDVSKFLHQGGVL
jgi:hypothetical protein